MTKRQLRKLTVNGLNEGKGKQEIYEELKLMSSLKPEEIAKVVQGVPTAAIKKKYMIFQVLLLIFLSIYVLAQGIVFYTGIIGYFDVNIFWTGVRLLLGLTIFIGVMTYSADAYRSGRIWMMLGLIRFVALGFLDGFYWLLLIDLGIYIGLVFFLFFLNEKLFPRYRLEKELYQNRLGEDRLRYAIKFDH